MNTLLFIKSKIQFFESKSQPITGCSVFGSVVYQVKDTIFWKQITTVCYWVNFPISLFIKSKIQFFESKSQPTMKVLSAVFCCLSSQRYNFLKANHNPEATDSIHFKLFIKSKIQFFESKSQHVGIVRE